MTRYSKIIGTGGYLPKNIVTNHQLAQRVDTSDEWIFERTGIRSRRIAGKDETAASMAEVAARQAIDAAKIEANTIDLILSLIHISEPTRRS